MERINQNNQNKTIIKRAVVKKPLDTKELFYYRKPNELGKIMILEYHSIGTKEAAWCRSRVNFKKDLEELYLRGFSLIGMHDFLDGKIETPKGRAPVIITFDDSLQNQFNVLSEKNGRIIIDKDCAVGILEDFFKKHPLFGFKACFFSCGITFFGQQKYNAFKIDYLKKHGLDIGNHTYSHINMKKQPNLIVTDLAKFQKFIYRLDPAYKIRTLGIPYGMFPSKENFDNAVSGKALGTEYYHEAIFKIGAEPALSIFHKNLDLQHIPRIIVTDKNLANWLAHFQKKPEQLFISDGDKTIITFPRHLQAEFNSKKWQAYPTHFND